MMFYTPNKMKLEIDQFISQRAELQAQISELTIKRDDLRKDLKDVKEEAKLATTTMIDFSRIDVFSIYRDDNITVVGYFLKGEKDRYVWNIKCSLLAHNGLISAFEYFKIGKK